MTYSLPTPLRDRLRSVREKRGRIVVLTGAGISAESGIPTFRGKDGYWTVGSREYQPQEMATRAMFSREPEHVWAWYLHRLHACRDAEPNPGHDAVVKIEQLFNDRFRLITQNVDGLHIRAGNSLRRTYQIHGNIDYARCMNACGAPLRRLSDILPIDAIEPALTAKQQHCLRCPQCGAWIRPHVLWFDEYYDEENYHYDSSIAAAMTADLLLVVGTSGATNLPMQIGQCAAERRALIVDINIDVNPFSRFAETTGGASLHGSGATVLPAIVSAFA